MWVFPANMRQYMEAGTSYNVLKLALLQVTRPELLEFWWELQAGAPCNNVNANVGRDLEKIRELDPRSYFPEEEKLRQRTLKADGGKHGVGYCRWWKHGEGRCRVPDCPRWHVELR